MRSIPFAVSVIATLVPSALAAVSFTSPAAGANEVPGTITITWTDDGTSPSLSTLSSYTIQLLVGGNTASEALPLTSVAGAFSSGNTASLPVAAGLAGPTANGFYLEMTSTATEGGTIINYSSHFNIPGMTGTTPSTYANAAAALDGATAGPATVNNLAGSGNTAAAAGGAEYTVPYYSQTGLTKYAPMQPVPPTSITATSYTPLFPTSSYSIATAALATPTILKTVTASQTFSVSSMANTAAAASNPNGDMAKYLARWKD